MLVLLSSSSPQHSSYQLILPDGSARVVATTVEHPEGEVHRLEDRGPRRIDQAAERVRALRVAYERGWRASPGSSGRAVYPNDAGLGEAFVRGCADAHGVLTCQRSQWRDVVGVREDGGAVFGPVAGPR